MEKTIEKTEMSNPVELVKEAVKRASKKTRLKKIYEKSKPFVQSTGESIFSSSGYNCSLNDRDSLFHSNLLF